MISINDDIRSSKWLKDRFEYLKQRYFSDIEIKNNIIVKFGRPCKTRLGSIKKGRRIENFNSIITINGHFRDPQIPSYVVDAVLAHEFMHYGHGFASPHEQAYDFPHQGGVIDNDLKERGLYDILQSEKVWIKKNWEAYLKKNHSFKSHHRSIFGIFFK